MKQASHFIEVIKYQNGEVLAMAAAKINYLPWAMMASERLNTETIAIFKIYPKNNGKSN